MSPERTASQSSVLMGGGSGADEEAREDEVGGLGLRLQSTEVGSDGGDMRRRLVSWPFPARASSRLDMGRALIMSMGGA